MADRARFAVGEQDDHQFAVMLLSLIRALALALFNFVCLSFGETTTGQLSGTASLYSYFFRLDRDRLHAHPITARYPRG